MVLLFTSSLSFSFKLIVLTPFEAGEQFFDPFFHGLLVHKRDSRFEILLKWYALDFG